jgi:hypothetical protein
MATKTLYIDSRTKISGSHSNFKISLPEELTLRGARVRVDNIRTTDTFKTVSSRNKFAYFLDGSGALSSVALDEAAYTGSTFATELAAKTSRASTYVSTSNALQLAHAAATRIIYDDAELKAFPASSFPAGASPDQPNSINDILGSSASISGSTITFSFITMAPLQDLYLCSNHLMVDHSWMPRGQRNALAKISLPGGFGTTVQAATPENIFHDLGDYVTLKEIDFQLRDYNGSTVDLLSPISFQLIFDC